MSVTLDSDRIRRVSAEISVPGIADRAWRAIATGPGISLKFVPTDFFLRYRRNPHPAGK